MRKQQQQQILELLRTIGQAQAAGLYADCQEGALSAGAFIESVEGADNPRIAGTIALLAEYCELLYRAHKGEIGEKQLRKQLINMENSVRNELAPDRIEIAFLSYNASMSDSIESIYLAANSDPYCDAYWIPIPYCERRPDGSLGAMRYEGAECYGDGIECVDWREYDIEARRPDVIFTFNPYDGGNLVTSVHPDFYCERLRDLTDLLVYVPYFVTADDTVEKHFCTLAGCVFAHRVILQSEGVRGVYVREFRKAYGNRFGRPEDKFVALGSPKFDKVINTKREDCVLPDAWRKLIGDRKVIFYNTSIGALLAGNEQYLRKLRHVLDTFKNRGDVALWWRPHPLNEATYSSMRPQLLAAYKRIIADYRRAGWGIYDDTADLHRAIAWTDAYYGDGSSVVALYVAAGKPVMIQHVFTHRKMNDCISLAINRFCFAGGSVWFAATEFNGLFRLNLDTWDVLYIGSFPNEPFTKHDMYDGVIEFNEKLYFAPLTASSIGVYDIAKGKFETIELPYDVEFDCNKWKFSDAIVRVDRKLVFVPSLYPAILVYDTLSGKIDICSDVISSLSRNSEISTVDQCSFRFAFPLGNKVFIPYNQGNKIVIFDIDTMDWELRTVGRANVAFCDIEFDGKDFWLPSYTSDGGLFRWNYETDEFTVFPFPHKIANRYNVGIYAVLRYGEKLRLIPGYGNSAWVFDMPTQTYCVDEVLQSECDIEYDAGLHRGEANYTKPVSVGKTVYAQCPKTNRFFEYNLETGRHRKEELTVPKTGRIKEALFQSLAYLVRSGGNITEGVAGLADMADVLMKENTNKGNKGSNSARQNDCGKSGEAILAHCIRQWRGN